MGTRTPDVTSLGVSIDDGGGQHCHFALKLTLINCSWVEIWLRSREGHNFTVTCDNINSLRKEIVTGLKKEKKKAVTGK